MPNAYTWQFPKLDVFPSYAGLTNVVESIHWRLTADDGAGHTATSYGEQPAGPPDPGSFTPFPSLTFSQVQGWVEAAIAADFALVQSDLDRMIAQQVAPLVVAMSPPWV